MALTNCCRRLADTSLNFHYRELTIISNKCRYNIARRRRARRIRSPGALLVFSPPFPLHLSLHRLVDDDRNGAEGKKERV